MRFLRIDEVPLGELMVYRISPVKPIVTCLMFLPMMGMLCWLGIKLTWVWFVLGFLALALMYMARQVTYCFGPQAWLAAVGKGKLYLKWRPYQNTHLRAEDLQVVEVELMRIAGSRFVSSWSLGEYSAHFDDCVELRFSSSVDAKPLGVKLIEEQNLGSTRGQYPLILHSENVLRVQWQARPGAREFLRVLESHEVPLNG